jgi:hypothetical protein
MRIDPLSTGSSPVEQLRDKLRKPVNPLENGLDDIDLSFMDLLGGIIAENTVAAPTVDRAEKAPEKPKAKEASSMSPVKDEPIPGKLTLVDRAHTSRKSAEDEAVDHDLILLKDALTPADIQYMKQVVIPGLPILVGNVPSETIFPTGENGEISYRGFEVSTQLSELIEKGYRTGQAIRVDLDPNSAVILKIRNGEVSAQFVSADKLAGSGMQQSLDDLRNRMLARNLPVGQLEYQYRDAAQPQKREQEQDTPEDAKSE